MQARKKILVTGTLEDTLASKVAEYHDIDVIPLIAIEPVKNEQLISSIVALKERALRVVFTSYNGVKAVWDILNQKPADWNLYSIEGVTSRSVQEHFGADSLAATAYTGEELADEILKDGDITGVVFFCGDLRRDELPERLRSEGVSVTEIIVYTTVATPVKVEKEYDAIVFFSPSSVYSYAAMNKVPKEAVCFAIGNTTANTIKNIVPNKVLIAQPPKKERVVEMLIEYYNNEPIEK